MNTKKVSAVALALLVAACGSGANGNQPSKPGVIGRWELVGGTVDRASFPVIDYRIAMVVELDRP